MGDHTRAIVVHGIGDLRIEDIPLAVPEDHEAIVSIRYGGICGSDLHYVSHGAAGSSILSEPLVLGHEVSGVVLQPAADGSGPAAGSIVAVHPGRVGGAAARFPVGRPNLSDRASYLGSAARLPHTAGAFADRVVLPGSMLVAAPEGLDARAVAIAEPAGVAWHAVARAGTVAGRRVAVVGCGPIGALLVAVLRRAGASEVTAVDVHELPLSIARSCGAQRLISAADTEAIELVAADVVFEASGNPRGLDTALRAAARGGTVVMVGLLPPDPQPVAITTVISRELALIGSFRFVDEIEPVLVALADGTLRPEGVVTHEFPAADALEAFRVAADPSISGKVLLAFPG